MKKLLFPLMIIIFCSSCNNYYKAITGSHPVQSNEIAELKAQNKYFILRNGSEAFAMTNMSLSSDEKNLHCTLETLPQVHTLHLTKGVKGKLMYRKPNTTDFDDTPVLKEVHLFISPGNKASLGTYTLWLDEIQKIEIIEHDKVKTKKSHAMGTAIGVSSAVAGIGIIVAAIAASELSSLFSF